MNRQRLAALLLIGVFSLPLPGCHAPSRLSSHQRMERGLVLVLPGIEGRSLFNRNIAVGLEDGGIQSAIEIVDWTTRIPGAFITNLSDYERNRQQAQQLADRIRRYSEKYPDNPVHLIGHSAGGGIAVMALEALPPESKLVDMAIVLAPALSPQYDLSTALRRTRRGLMNFYSEFDVSLLTVGTTVFGPVDRDHGPAAGAVGFRTPPGMSRAERTLYELRLKQVRWTPRLRRYGASGTHLGWARREFARDYLARFVNENEIARARATARRRAQEREAAGDEPESSDGSPPE
jgi:pimeloyl-ACP methyl ester carboxylesterase